MLHTRLCDLLGIEVPIIVAPMGPNITGVDLAAAVSNAGGLGIISFGANPPPLLREQIQRLRELTDRPFGVNFILEFPVEDHVAVCIEEKIPVLSFFWGDPSPYVDQAHAAGLKVFDQVGSVKEDERSARAGVDVIIAQGLEASEEDTVRTTLFGYGWPNAPHRALRTRFVEEWLQEEARGSEQRSDEPVIGETLLGGQRIPLLRFMGFPPSTDATGDIESMGLLAGQSAGLVREIKPAADVVRELVEGAQRIIEGRLNPAIANN